MAHDIFISHSSKDKAVSDAVCAALESAGIRCWVAPRDVQPGRSFAGEINRAIQHSKVMVLIFSAHSNNSEQVLREVQLAVNSHLHIIQFRIEDVRLNDDLEYFLSTPHWLDALTPPLENHMERLKTSIQTLLDVPAEQSAAASSVSSSSEKREVSVMVPQEQEVSTAGTAPSPPVNRGRKFVFAGAIVALITAGVFAWWFGLEQPRQNAERQRQSTPQKVKGDSPKAAAVASKEQPYVNSVGMKFVPVPGTGVLFSVWETRVKDYKVFVEATKREWPKPRFQQTEEHPAVNVSWEDATAFCEWLTEQERAAGRISARQSYRLPSDEEWSTAVGLEKEGGSTPKERDMKVKDVYPWGTKWPPPDGAGNYDPTLKVDDYENTSPVGSFEANHYGIHDLGGNVLEWCQDWYDAEKKSRVLRGASWSGDSGFLPSSLRRVSSPEFRGDRSGFRCVMVVEASRKAEDAKTKEDSLKAAAAASKEQPYVNSLGMKFVPVPGTGVLFSIWETRVKDYKVFVEAKSREWWPKPSFQQTEEHPAVNVNWEDANAFCEWLTEQERSAGRISARQSYRLPSDEEWSAAVGLEKEGGSTPKERDMKVKDVYPWGTKWPPTNGSGNYDPSLMVDDYKNTSPAGTFEANRYGIHDLGGNVWEWCQDWYDAEKKYRVLRGASWVRQSPDRLLSSYRLNFTPQARYDYIGFRCVLVVQSSR